MALAEARQQMDKAIEAVRREFGGVRTGKATPALLDTVRVDAYGSMMSLSQVASVSAPEPRLLVVQPWDKGMLAAIERGIRETETGLNPANDGSVIRIPIPALNEERRKEMAKLIHKMAEEGRVAVRLARQHANDSIKKQQKDGKVSEDDAHRQTDETQKLTDATIKKIDEMIAAKEAEIMEV